MLTTKFLRFVIALGFSFAWGLADAADVTVKIALSSTGDHIANQMSRIISMELEKRIPGRVTVQIFEGGQLGGDSTIMKGLIQGTHSMTMNGSWFQNIEPGFNVFDTPFLFRNREEVKKVIAAVQPDLATAIMPKGIVLVGIGDLGFRQISNNVRPIIQPSDLRGVKLRVPGSPFRVETFRTLGADPVPMGADELYMALRQGVLDGEENPLASIWTYKWYEVQKYISLSNHIFTPLFVGISAKHWNTWPPEIREAMVSAVQVACDFAFRFSAEQDGKLQAEMLKANPNIKFNDIDVAAFKRVAEPLNAKVQTLVGPALWSKTMDALK